MTESSTEVPTILWEEAELILARGTAPDPTSALLMTPASAAARARIEHAYTLRNDVESGWAARPRALLRRPDGRPMLVLDDPGGELLARSIERRVGLPTALRMAIGLVRAVGKLHERGLVHKDIKPSHVLVAPSGAAWLLGFGIAERLPCGRPEATLPPELIPGTLAYMSPEQTGRANRAVDVRSDLYSVGITLYETFTGSLPFTASTPAEWIDRHTTRQPAPIVAESGIPGALAAIVMKLLEKDADDRYPSAAVLEADLQRCLTELERHGWIDPFELATLTAAAVEDAKLHAELRRSLDEKDALLEEVHHRVKHNLQLISSLLSLQSARTSDPAVAELFADSRNRIRSMALVHETLYRAGGGARIDMDRHIRQLCTQLAEAYHARSPALELAIDTGGVSLTMDQTVPCGLIVNELVSNAFKHAFPDDRTGRVRVTLRPLSPRGYRLTVEDDGVGLPPGFDVASIDSLGLQLVQDLTNQLHGTLTIEPGPGASFSIAFDEPPSERPSRVSS